MLQRCSPDGRQTRDSTIYVETVVAAATAVCKGMRLHFPTPEIFYLRQPGEKRCLLQRRGEQSKERVAVNKSSGERLPYLAACTTYTLYQH